MNAVCEHIKSVAFLLRSLQIPQAGALSA